MLKLNTPTLTYFVYIKVKPFNQYVNFYKEIRILFMQKRAVGLSLLLLYLNHFYWTGNLHLIIQTFITHQFAMVTFLNNLSILHDKN